MTHQFELGLSGGRDPHRLDAFLARDWVIETQERLVWLDTFLSIFLHHLERQLQDIGGGELEGSWLLVERETVTTRA